MSSNTYVNLRQDAKDDTCAEFQRRYPDHTKEEIDRVFAQINPVVEWDNENFTGYHVWEAHRPRFEKMLNQS